MFFFICFCRCVNFLVYEDAVLEPGQGLNLLVGPNGSGKTTWANAILIGLGASPKVCFFFLRDGDFFLKMMRNLIILFECSILQGVITKEVL